MSGEVIADGLRLGTVSRADIEDGANPYSSANPDNSAKPDNNAKSDSIADPDNKANPAGLDRIACRLAVAYTGLGAAFKAPYFDLNG